MPAKRSTRTPALTSPNQYHLTGDGVAVSYYPKGLGPVPKGGPICLVFQDASGVQTFTKRQLRTVESDDFGNVISVLIARTVDLGSTTLSVLIPEVRLPEGLGASASIQTLAVKTFHRTFLAGPGQGQEEIYTTVALAGDARSGPLPA
jgi:hypothetical protein